MLAFMVVQGGLSDEVAFVPSPQERAMRIPGEHLTWETCGKAQRGFTEVHLSGVERECREREEEGLDSWCGVKSS